MATTTEELLVAQLLADRRSQRSGGFFQWLIIGAIVVGAIWYVYSYSTEVVDTVATPVPPVSTAIIAVPPTAISVVRIATAVPVVQPRGVIQAPAVQPEVQAPVQVEEQPTAEPIIQQQPQPQVQQQQQQQVLERAPRVQAQPTAAKVIVTPAWSNEPTPQWVEDQPLIKVPDIMPAPPGGGGGGGGSGGFG